MKRTLALLMLIAISGEMLCGFQQNEVVTARRRSSGVATHTFALVQDYNITCASGASCVVTPAAGGCQFGTCGALGTGHVVVIWASNGNGAANFISTSTVPSGGGTWAVPTGCEQNDAGQGGIGSVSCAYTLSSSSASSVTVTFNGTFAATIDLREYSFTGGGSAALDCTGHVDNGTTSQTGQPGATCTASGSSNVTVQSLVATSGTSTVTINQSYGNKFGAGFYAWADLLNVAIGTTPTWNLGSAGYSVGGIISIK